MGMQASQDQWTIQRKLLLLPGNPEVCVRCSSLPAVLALCRYLVPIYYMLETSCLRNLVACLWLRMLCVCLYSFKLVCTLVY